MLERVWGKGNPPTRWWGWKLVQPLWRTVWRFFKELETDLAYDPAISLLNMYQEKTIIRKDTCTSMFIAVLFTIAKTWKQPKYPSTDKWIKKMWYVYTREYYSAIKRNEVWIHVTTSINLKNLISERSLTDKFTYCVILFYEFSLYSEWANAERQKSDCRLQGVWAKGVHEE